MEKPKDSYHHGDLRAALVAAAEATLAETGVEGFSLRQVAKRVGVSHSAPAHHFGDSAGAAVRAGGRGVPAVPRGDAGAAGGGGAGRAGAARRPRGSAISTSPRARRRSSG